MKIYFSLENCMKIMQFFETLNLNNCFVPLLMGFSFWTSKFHIEQFPMLNKLLIEFRNQCLKIEKNSIMYRNQVMHDLHASEIKCQYNESLFSLFDLF